MKSHFNQLVEHITWHDQHIATIIRRDFVPEKQILFRP